MSVKEGKDYIYLVWKDLKTRRQFVVGELTKNGNYEFSYGHEVKEAIEKGFELLISFQNIDKLYTSDILFPAFSSRLPDEKRKGIEKILQRYELYEYDEYELLKRSGAKLPIDNLQFIDPILLEEDFVREFYLAGPRHYIGCSEGVNCNMSRNVNTGDGVRLLLEPTNPYDKNAVMVLDSDNNLLGYVPRFFSREVTQRINNNEISYKCRVVEVNKNNNCDECIKLLLEMKRC